MNPQQPDGELRILVGGFLEECIGQIIAKVVEQSLGYARVNVRIIEALYRSAKTGRSVRIPPFGTTKKPDARQTIKRPGIAKPKQIKVKSASED